MRKDLDTFILDRDNPFLKDKVLYYSSKKEIFLS